MSSTHQCNYDYSSDSSGDSGSDTPPGGDVGQSVVAEICEELASKGEHLNKEIEEMRSLEGSCVKALERLHLEQMAWSEKLRGIKARMSQIEKKKDETALMLDLHQVLRSSGGLEEAVRVAQQAVSAEVKDELEDDIYVPCELESGKCAVCSDEIAPEEMLAKLKRNYKSRPLNRLTMCRKCSSTLRESKSNFST